MDRFNVAGLDSTCGFASWIEKAKTPNDEGVLVSRLRSLGALIFCKTNVPMSMMVYIPLLPCSLALTLTRTDG